ncbi:glycosyltransferase family 2 protein [Streptoalloteichus tenebrarius]|uniref:glycosyltransferase family 2 protein n=1 Tax=Streptoalloteichus tenebrarius (strain ATCC 17920 / DSM 40477 / JCM 4838 / CBS 697.72 / NBRC 16177 / NCIMB 11028 / NRRL B-12390 / A12253. 1 / ISP 5477) TaxID=1933 RepID=UPI0020A50B16|nr:glycosyltransferase family 2 protein [Streptoalloteichus tenebrarius]
MAEQAERNPARTTVVVVTWRGREHVGGCLDALAAQDRPHRTLVVDNASDDGTADLLAAHPSRPRVLRLGRNLGYAGGLAVALSHVDTPWVAWLNDDAAPEPGWLGALEDALDADPRVAAAGSLLLRADGSVQSAGVRLTPDGHGADLPEPPPGGEPFGFCGGAVLMRVDALRAVGGVPADFFCYYEDTDTAWRLRLAGRRIVTVPAARVGHRHGASTHPGSTQFHLWNERNRLLTLLRCAPAEVAARELTRFAVITALLPARRALGREVPDARNFRVSLRLRVLGEVLARLPETLSARRRIGRRRVVGRGAVWHRWAGR